MKNVSAFLVVFLIFSSLIISCGCGTAKKGKHSVKETRQDCNVCNGTGKYATKRLEGGTIKLGPPGAVTRE